MIESVAAAFAGLGKRPRGMPAAFAHAHCPRWRNVVMSPVWPSACDRAFRIVTFFKP